MDGLDVRRLPLSPEEAFVLSRVDGSSTPSDIAASTGLSDERVQQCLTRLSSLGAISFPGSPSQPVQRSEAGGPVRRTSSVRLRAIIEESTDVAARHPAAREYDAKLLDEPADLSAERKKQILDTFYALDRLNHYQLLGVPEDAEKKTIKTAYYELVGIFHTDRYFGKNLGAFKPRLEKVFGALTKAHDTLTRSKARDDYDRYLVARRRTAGLESTAPPRRMTPAPAPVIESPIAPTASGPRLSSSTQHEDPFIPPPPRWSGDGAPSAPPADPEAARRALARKLRGAKGSVPPPPAAVDDEEVKRAVTEDLKNLYERRLIDGQQSQLARYRELAEQAMNGGNLASAINALKVALSVTPDDKELLAMLAEAEERSDVAMADQFLEQAKYEEQDGQPVRAAKAYGRAARGKKSAQLYDRAASCLVEASTDLRQAVEYARKATALDPKRALYRLTLARAYYLSNMPTSGAAEMKRALELAPDNDDVKAWAKRLK